MTTYTIGQLAKAAGVPTTTLRYYERLGILRPCKHRKGDYREYGALELERLRFIRAAAATGLTLKDAAELLRVADGDELPCDAVRDRLLARYKAVRRQIRDLRKVRDKLREAVANCCVSGAGDDAGLCGAAMSLRGDAPEAVARKMEAYRLTLHAGATATVGSWGKADRRRPRERRAAPCPPPDGTCCEDRRR
jgi:MerR family mercuric resistance operon transcriptional regulator